MTEQQLQPVSAAGAEAADHVPAVSATDSAADDGAVTARSRRRWPWLVLALVVVAGGIYTAASRDGVGGATPEPQTALLDFAEVEVADLIQEETYDGTLGTAAGEPVRSQVSGTVTWAPEPGATVGEGDVLFEVDGRPVVLIHGDVPAYRQLATPEEAVVPGIANGRNGTVTRVAEPGTFEQGDILYWVNEEPVVLLYGELPLYRSIHQPRFGDVSGDDVVQLKEALIALGFDPDGSVGSGATFGGNAEAMVERWQEEIGANVDGSVDPGDVIYSEGPVVVSEFLIEPGDQIAAGQAVAEVPDDDQPDLPSGPDVAQLEAGLARLGFDADGALVVDGVWDDATESAVEGWQASLGLEADGVVAPGDIVFLSEAVQIRDQLVAVGGNVGLGAAVLDVSSEEKLVTMDLPAADQGALEAGDRVAVELPDGTEVAATVVEVASIATVGNNNTAVFEVTISLDDPAVASGLDEAPVDVLVVTDSAIGVLAVPVTALVVLAEGGYAVEVDAGGGATRLVGVEVGFFADGLVEISGADLVAGDRVVVP